MASIKDWLLSLELYELAKQNKMESFTSEIRQHLEKLKISRPKIAHLIEDGLELIHS